MTRKYQAFDPNAKVVGRSMLAFIQCIRRENIAPFLEVHGLTDIIPDQWYSQQTWLDVLNDLAEESPGSAMFNFVAVGMKASETSPIPREVDALPVDQAFKLVNDAYVAQFHRGNAGEVITELVEARHLKFTVRVPYPDDLFYGSICALARRLLVGKQFTVRYDEDKPRRDQGSEETIIHPTWE